MTELVEDIDRGWNRIVRDMTEGKRKGLVVDVGVVGSEAEEIHAEDSALTNADVGLFHEYGTTGVSLGRSGAESGAVPERSFLRATIDEKHSQIARIFERISRGVIDGKVSESRGLGLAGEQVVSWIKARIRAHIAPALMPATIARKGSSTPLIDTGQLIGSLTHAVRGAGEGEK